jgi:protoporphyrinogen oxidase
MESLRYKFVIVGAGINGLIIADELSKYYCGEIILLEKEDETGGLCKTIRKNGLSYDFGSHRFHKEINKETLDFIDNISGNLLIKKTRQGKLILKKSYIEYPVKSFRLFTELGIKELFLCSISFFLRVLFYKGLNYESCLKREVGNRAYNIFYKSYAKKLWGCDPKYISFKAAKSRTSMSKNPLALLKDMFLYYFKGGEDYFYYLDGGIGIFANGLEKKIKNKGVKIIKGVKDFLIENPKADKRIFFNAQGNSYSIEFDKLISTIPIDDLVLKLNPDKKICNILGKIRWRGLKLIYMHIKEDPKLEGETFYFPEEKYKIGRVSIPKRFSDLMQRDNSFTSFVCEIPCSKGDDIWNMCSKDIYDICFNDLVVSGLISGAYGYLSEKNFIINLPSVYPVFVTGWQESINSVLEYLSKEFPYIYVSGRRGLFLQSNSDHSIDIGKLLAQYLLQGKSSKEWYKNINFFQNLKSRD